MRLILSVISFEVDLKYTVELCIVNKNQVHTGRLQPPMQSLSSVHHIWRLYYISTENSARLFNDIA
jgi:hypothetical protein